MMGTLSTWIILRPTAGWIWIFLFLENSTSWAGLSGSEIKLFSNYKPI